VTLNKITRRVLILGVVGPALLAPLIALGWQGYPWWRYLVAIVGGGYLIPVFGTLAGRKLLAIPQKASSAISFVLRALVGVLIYSAILMVVTTSLGDTAMWLFSSSSGLIVLLVVGFSYAGFPAIVHWLQQRKRK